MGRAGKDRELAVEAHQPHETISQALALPTHRPRAHHSTDDITGGKHEPLGATQAAESSEVIEN